MANVAMEARKSGIEFVFIVLGIFIFMQSSSFGLQSDGAFQDRAQSLYLLQDLFPAKGRNFLRKLVGGFKTARTRTQSQGAGMRSRGITE